MAVATALMITVPTPFLWAVLILCVVIGLLNAAQYIVDSIGEGEKPSEYLLGALSCFLWTALIVSVICVVVYGALMLFYSGGIFVW